MNDNDKPKTTLTPEEKIRAAYVKVTWPETSDATIAAMLGVTNLGRVNEALKLVLSAVGLSEPGYKNKGEREAESEEE